MNEKYQLQEAQSGLDQVDPNFGARSVAMTRIDQLLRTNLLVRTEFATHEGRMGTVGETAHGKRGSDEIHTYFLTSEERDQSDAGGIGIALEDPVLQRRLNELQILDARGQLDRHAGNFFIQTDADANVAGITGFDLAMAFGKDLRTARRSRCRPVQEVPAECHDRESPPSSASTSCLTTDTEVAHAVEGLLMPDEVDAIVERSTHSGRDRPPQELWSARQGVDPRHPRCRAALHPDVPTALRLNLVHERLVSGDY